MRPERTNKSKKDREKDRERKSDNQRERDEEPCRKSFKAVQVCFAKSCKSFPKPSCEHAHIAGEEGDPIFVV